MHREDLLALLRQLRAGEVDDGAVADRLTNLPFEDVGFAKIDHHRALRSGMPEAVYAAGKTAEQVAIILGRLAAAGVPALATRADPEKAAAVLAAVPGAVYHAVPRCITLAPAQSPQAPALSGPIAVICAGTSDLPVAEEAALTAELYGAEVLRIVDVGVAGIHRLLAQLPTLRRAQAVVACAGMEGALASVLGGLVAVPVIAVPTSVGYGASLGGLAALMGMLNSCSPNTAVVNIDNGFGAGYLACLIARKQE